MDAVTLNDVTVRDKCNIFSLACSSPYCNDEKINRVGQPTYTPIVQPHVLLPNVSNDTFSWTNLLIQASNLL